jgi:WD40 repeat protein
MMNQLVLLPTPNWFTSRPVDIDVNTGTVALSVMGSIYLTTNLFQKFHISLKDVHAKRINSVAFNNKTNFNQQKTTYLASCSEDLCIKVWNVDNEMSQSSQLNQLHQNTPTCIDWLHLPPSEEQNILVSCDIKGNIFKWNCETGAHVRYFPENKAITQVKACPGQSHLIAIGYKQGNIVLLDIQSDKMKIVHKLKNHENTINCLNWYPLNDNEVSFKTLLCSSSEDKTIRLWCTDKGVQLKCINAPGFNTKSQDSKTQQPKISFIPLNWPNPQYITSGSYR